MVDVMSVNESIAERLEEGDGSDLPDLYSRELKRKKNSLYGSHSSENDRGGYSEWKARNGMDTSDRMVSSLGKAIHNQGIITQKDKDFHEMSNLCESHSNSLPNAECNMKDQHKVRLNASELCYTPQSFRGAQHSNDLMYRNDQQSYSRGEMLSHPNGKQYNYSSRDGSEHDFISEEHDRCMGPCCVNQTMKSPMTTHNHQRSQNNRESLVHNRNMNSSKVPYSDHHFHNSDLMQNHNSTMNHTPYRLPHQLQSHHNIAYPQCHQPQLTCQCCQNKNEIPRQTISPPSHKKCSVSRKTESSIKKLYRILWLQNEQLGLLERQVSKLIEVNFTKVSSEKSTDDENTPVNNSDTTTETLKKSVETCEVGVMTDFPCLNCCDNEMKNKSSESDPEINKRPSAEESLTLFGVDIPVTGDEISSPPVSIHIDMQEFNESSSSEIDESDTTEDESEPVGWTFYDNVVGQVNNILKSANKKKNKKKLGYNEEMNLAVEHLKRIGVTAPDLETNNAKRVTFEQGLKAQQSNLKAQSEISMNFNALAAKYLSSAGGKVQDISMCNVISSNTNMSMATMRYLERHQIANRDEMDIMPKKYPGLKNRKIRTNGEKAVTSKFLDITAIRQQPKLLPKDI